MQGVPLWKPPYGRITAIDLNTGDHRWMVPMGEPVAQSNPILKQLSLPPVGRAACLASSCPSGAPGRRARRDILGLGVRLALYRGPSVDRPRLSIAVLPFSNLSGDPDQEYVSDALTEDLTTDLSRIEGALVIARNTMQTYRGKAVDVKQLGRELGVRYLLEGSVGRAEQQVRVTAQLIDAETGAHLWAERFDRSAADLLTLQAEVTGQIARMLNLQLMEAESQRTSRGWPDTLEAIDYARKAWADIWNKPLTQETNAQALVYLEQARALDPTVSEIWTHLAICGVSTCGVLRVEPIAGGIVATRCLFRKSDASRTSCLRKQASSPHGSYPLDSRFRGNDARLQALVGYL